MKEPVIPEMCKGWIRVENDERIGFINPALVTSVTLRDKWVSISTTGNGWSVPLDEVTWPSVD